LATVGIYFFIAQKPPIVAMPAEFELQEAIIIAYKKQALSNSRAIGGLDVAIKNINRFPAIFVFRDER
jgi:hypothetical protein